MPYPKLLLACVLAATAGGAQAACEDLKAKIEAKFQAKGVTGYRLEAVPTGSATHGTVVGTCEGGSRQMVYSRGAARGPGATAAAPAAPAAPAAKAAAPADPKAPAKPPARKNSPAPALGNY